MKISFKRLVSVLKLSNSFYVSIPATVLELLEIQKGDKMTVELDGDRVIYTKVKQN